MRAGTTPGRVNFQSMNFVPVTKQPSYSAPTRTIATAVIKGKAMEPADPGDAGAGRGPA